MNGIPLPVGIVSPVLTCLLVATTQTPNGNHSALQQYEQAVVAIAAAITTASATADMDFGTSVERVAKSG